MKSKSAVTKNINDEVAAVNEGPTFNEVSISLVDIVYNDLSTMQTKNTEAEKKLREAVNLFQSLLKTIILQSGNSLENIVDISLESDDKSLVLKYVVK